MKSLNAKRIAAIAASLAVGLAFAGSNGVLYNSIPIIKSTGQPAVTIVVGSNSAPSDGVVAANIAAVIGNLAYASTNITATVGNQGAVSCVVTTPTCTLSNQQVWLGEKGTITAAGSYTLVTLIGSVLNAAVLNYNVLTNAKNLQGGTNNQYAYPEDSSPYPISTTPLMISAWAGLGPVTPANGGVTSSSNGGGVTFSKFTDTVGGISYDNVVELSSSQVPGLLSSSGQYSESEYLWLMGFPVFNQSSGADAFQVVGANGAYQVVFGKPIQIFTNQAKNINHATFSILGEQYILYNASPASSPAASVVPSNEFSIGGKLELAQAATSLQTVYVGHNITTGPFKVVLQDLSYPTSNGVSDAAVAVYKNGNLTNETSIAPYFTAPVNSSGTPIYIYVGTTFPGLYAYQKWAQMQLYTNVFNVTNGKLFNTNNPEWIAQLRWTTNQSAPLSAAVAANGFAANAALQSIVLYSNLSKSWQLSSGQGFDFIQNPSIWKVTFVGDTLGAPGSGNTNYDQLSFTTSSESASTFGFYANPSSYGAATQTVVANTFASGVIAAAGASGQSNTINVTSITEPQSLFTVTSGLTSSFTVTNTISSPPSSAVSSVTYALDTYKYLPLGAVDSAGYNDLITSEINPGLVVSLTNNGVNGNYVSNNNQLTVYVTGYRPFATTTSSVPVVFSAFGNVPVNGFELGNLTDITLSSPIPAPGVEVSVYETANTANALTTGAVGANAVELGALLYAGPRIVYSSPQYSYWLSTNAITASVNFTQESSTNLPFKLNLGTTTNNVARNQYFTYNVPEISLPGVTNVNSILSIGITNSSSILSNPQYWLNISNGNNNYLTYYTDTNPNPGTWTTTKAGQGFRTERGSEVALIQQSPSPTSVTIDEARSIDTLQLIAGPANSTVSTTTKVYGPYGVGVATNIPNVTIYNVTASCAFSTTSCQVVGENNLTATPSSNIAITPVPLNTSRTPLAVLDTAANQSATLISIGSGYQIAPGKYVNSVSETIFANNPSLQSSFGPGSVVSTSFGTNRILVAGYTANETVTAGNQFIEALLAAAGES